MWGYPPGWFLPDHSLTKNLSAVFGCSLSLVGSQVVHSPPLKAEFHHLTFLALDWKCSNLMIPMFRNVLNCVPLFDYKKTCELGCYIYIYIDLSSYTYKGRVSNLSNSKHRICLAYVLLSTSSPTATGESSCVPWICQAPCGWVRWHAS